MGWVSKFSLIGPLQKCKGSFFAQKKRVSYDTPMLLLVVEYF
jgi:hypothetical protein